MSVEEWKRTKLGHHIRTKKGYAFKSKWYSEKGTPIVKVSDFTEDSVSISELTCIPNEIAEKYKEYSLKKNDVIIQTVGSWPTNPRSVVGKAIKVPLGIDGALLNQNAVKIISISHLNNRYLFYLLRSNDFKNYIVGCAQGAANQASITLDAIRNYEFILPPRNYQDKIASFLAIYDKLIENDLRCIQILERMAGLIYREWFVHFRFPRHQNAEIVETLHGSIPKGWSSANLSLMVDNVKEKEKAGVHLDNLLYIPISCIEKKSLFLRKTESGKKAQSSLIRFKKYDILFGAMRPYFHKVAMAPSDGVTRTTCFVLRPKNPLYYSYSLMTLFQESAIEYANSRTKGSTIPYAVWENGLADMPILVPNEDVLNKFNEIIVPIIEEIITSHFRINTLERTRDYLLPRIISGEIDLSETDILGD